MFDRPVERLPQSRWRSRFRLLSQIGKIDWKDRNSVPLLSNSPLSTPSSSPPRLKRDDDADTASLLTPLEVRSKEYFTPLTNQKCMMLGEFVLPPPPPPPRKLLYGDSCGFDVVLDPKPMAATKTRTRSFGAHMNQACSICQEPLASKLHLEKLVSLRCGDCVHGQCLQAIVEHNAELLLDGGDLLGTPSPELQEMLLPTCKGELCLPAGLECPVCPVDKELVQCMVYEAVLTLKLARVNRKLLTENGFFDADYSSPFQDPTTKESPLYPQLAEFSWSLCSKAMARDFSFRSLDPGFQSRPVSVAQSMITNLTVSVRVSEHEKLPVEDLKNAFIKHMIDSCGTFELSMLVGLGPLRLVDRLLVSLDKSPYCLSKVYLFANYLIIWETVDPTLLHLKDVKSIGTPELSVVEVNFHHTTVSVRLHSETASIIEKWGIAISDPDLVFPSDIFTSTMSIYDLDNKLNLHGYQYGKKVSPIQEKTQENSPVEETPRAIFSRDRSTIYEQSVELLTGSALSLLPPISPLRLCKRAVSCYNSSDSDTDSDDELITKIMEKKA